jgi:hypothetical protein
MQQVNKTMLNYSFFTKIQICNIHVVKPKLQARVDRKFPIGSYAHSIPNDCVSALLEMVASKT